MKILYFDCSFGAAGDMLTAAVFGLLDEAGKKEFLEKMNSLGMSGVRISIEDVSRCHIAAHKYIVDIHGEEEHQFDSHVFLADEHGNECDEHNHDHGHNHIHGHASLVDILDSIDSLRVSDKVKAEAKEIYGRFAKAECEVHGKTPETIHFHEIGMADSVCDIVGFAVAIEILGADQIVFSPVTTGFGTVKCAHGILQVPAPATIKLLEGVATKAGSFEGEMCTPTGAVLANYYAVDFGSCPDMKILASANGAGNKDFKDHPNIVRAVLGERESCPVAEPSPKFTDRITELSFNVDDMTGEQLSLACEIILESGARDVFTTPVFMKKGRPGQLVTVICDQNMKRQIAEIIFKHTSTIGIRERICDRMILDRHIEEREIDGQTVRVKVSEGYGVRKEKAEFEDLKRITKGE